MKPIMIFLLFIAPWAYTVMAQCLKQENPLSETICYGATTTIDLAEAETNDEGKVEGYLWQQYNNITFEWMDAGGDNAKIDYTTPELTEGMRYRRMVFGLCKEEPDTIYSAPAFIEVIPQLFITSQSADQTICFQIVPAALTISATGENGNFDFLWQQSENKLDWEDIIDTESVPFYAPKALGKTTYYRCIVSGDCKNDTTGIISVFVLPVFYSGSIKSNEVTVEEDENLTLRIDNYMYAAGGDGKITYRWKKDNEIVFGNDASLEIYSSALAIGTYLFTREAKDSTCTGGWILSAGSWKVTIYNETPPPPPPPPPCDIVPNNIVAKSNIDGTPYVLIYPNPDRVFSYQWYKNDTQITDATEQFFYPVDGILDMKAEYKVEIWEAHDPVCKAFSQPYHVQASNPVAPYFRVAPNPITEGNFTISFNRDLLNMVDAYSMAIYSSLGEKMWEEKLYNLDDLTVSQHLVKGIFFITLVTDNKQYTEKILVQ